MGATDKIKNTAEKLQGQGKEKAGEAKGDESLQAEGQADQSKGSMKNAAENVKDAFKS